MLYTLPMNYDSYIMLYVSQQPPQMSRARHFIYLPIKQDPTQVLICVLLHVFILGAYIDLIMMYLFTVVCYLMLEEASFDCRHHV